MAGLNQIISIITLNIKDIKPQVKEINGLDKKARPVYLYAPSKKP